MERSYEFPSNFASKKKKKMCNKLSTKNGVGTKFIANFCLCKVHMFWEGHKFLRNLHRRFALCSNGQICIGEMGLLQNLLQTFACVASEKKTKNGVATKFIVNVKLFLLVYTWFSNIVNDSASLHRLIKALKILQLCTVSIQDRSVINNELLWCKYGYSVENETDTH